MGYKKKASRDQIIFMPECLEDYVTEANPVRVIDAFIDSLDLNGMGFTKSIPAETGCPAYDPSDMLKLYVYGYSNHLRSSRRLMRESRRNVELMWLIGKLQPDFRTISDFRKENAKLLKEVFKEFVKLCDKLGLYKKELLAVDGSKFRAQNSKKKCFNAETLRKKLASIDNHITEFMKAMDASDATDAESELSVEQIKTAISDLNARKEKYEGYLQELSETGATQKLETDPDAHRMHSKDGFHCCYNVQTAVDGGSHLIADYEATSQANDYGLLNDVCKGAKENLDIEIIEAVADSGYESSEDILNCLMNGTIPNVALRYDKKVLILNIDYIESEITEDIRQSTKPDDIQKCIYAGVLPKCYENTTVSIELQERTEIGCFTRVDEDTVICPMGQTLKKTKMRDVKTVYASKEACSNCPNRCTSSSSHKTVTFGPETKHVAVWMYGTSRYDIIKPPEDFVPNNSFFSKNPVMKKVVIFINEDKEKYKQRMHLSEHPFGTVKWYHGAHYFLCRGKEKVTGELGLSFLAYNLRRAITLVGVPVLIAAARG
jgi:transposase